MTGRRHDRTTNKHKNVNTLGGRRDSLEGTYLSVQKMFKCVVVVRGKSDSTKMSQDLVVKTKGL